MVVRLHFWAMLTEVKKSTQLSVDWKNYSKFLVGSHDRVPLHASRISIEIDSKEITIYNFMFWKG